MKKGFTGIWVILIAAAVGLAIVAFGAGYWLSNQSDSDVVFVDDDVEDVEDIDEEEEEVEVEEVEPTVLENSEILDISWLSTHSEIEPNSALAMAFLDEDREPYDEDDVEEVIAYEIGEIQSGIYEGYKLTMQIAKIAGMGYAYDTFYILVPDNETQKSVLLDGYLTILGGFSSETEFDSVLERYDSSSSSNTGESVISVLAREMNFDTDSVIEEFEYGDIVDSDGNEYVLLGIGSYTGYPNEIDVREFSIEGYLDGKVLYRLSDHDGNLIEQTSDSALSVFDNLFFYTSADSRVIVYDIKVPFWDNVDGYNQVVPVAWDDGIENEYAYSKAESYRCGYMSPTNIADLDEIGSLEATGSVEAHGVVYDIYEPIEYSMEYYVDEYTQWLLRNDEGSFEEFIAMNPYFYYQDSLGRWIEFENNEIVPAAECGKPVIYLYPEEEMQIDVMIEPQGGFTYTEPVYDDGWSVIAQTDGTLTNLKDGKEYTYLFWEGRGGVYSAPKYYWVVEQAEVERFLIKTLGKYGLNNQEIFDFMEFWYPRMQEAPYYKIGFHGTQVMDAIAPMKLSVEPDSIFRILMDFTELNEPIASNPMKIETFDREGFTVVEWGGVIQ